MKIYAYCRVSTEQQNLDRQEDAIKKYVEENNINIDVWFADKISGKTFERDNYLQMKELVEEGDVIIIKELDRFGRSMSAIKEEWQYFMDKGVKIVVIDMPLISSDLSGTKTLDMQFISNMVFEMLCYMAEKEREKISQRTREGLRARKEAGVVLGRPVELPFGNQETYNYVLENYNKMPTQELREKLGLNETKFFYNLRKMKKQGIITENAQRGIKK